MLCGFLGWVKLILILLLERIENILFRCIAAFLFLKIKRSCQTWLNFIYCSAVAINKAEHRTFVFHLRFQIVVVWIRLENRCPPLKINRFGKPCSKAICWWADDRILISECFSYLIVLFLKILKGAVDWFCMWFEKGIVRFNRWGIAQVTWVCKSEFTAV